MRKGAKPKGYDEIKLNRFIQEHFLEWEKNTD